MCGRVKAVWPQEKLEQLLETAAAAVGVPLTSTQRGQLGIHFRLLLEWNRRINLTAIRDPEQAAARHFAESLFLSTLIPAPAGIFVDVGSGAGFPGLPLKVVWPESCCLLLEPNQKKATFLRDVVRQAGLRGVAVEAARVESLVESATAGEAWLVTMRAVAAEAQLLAAIRRLLRSDGIVALFLGENDAADLTRSEGFQWEPAHAVPDASQRVILIGRRY